MIAEADRKLLAKLQELGLEEDEEAALCFVDGKVFVPDAIADHMNTHWTTVTIAQTKKDIQEFEEG